jgi:hypothetical protein
MFQDLETLMKRQRERWGDYTAVWTPDAADAAAVQQAGVPAEQQADRPERRPERALALAPVLDPQVLERVNEWYDFMLGSHSDERHSDERHSDERHSDERQFDERGMLPVSDDARDAVFDRMSDDELDAVFARMP